jgi:superfamily I DNA/RNA helicase
MVLEPLTAIYDQGNARYFESIVAVIEAARLRGHHVPRLDALRALQRTAEALSGGAYDLDEAVQHYSEHVLAAAHAAPRTHEGLFVMTAHQAKGKEFAVRAEKGVYARLRR